MLVFLLVGTLCMSQFVGQILYVRFSLTIKFCHKKKKKQLCYRQKLILKLIFLFKGYTKLLHNESIKINLRIIKS